MTLRLDLDPTSVWSTLIIGSLYPRRPVLYASGRRGPSSHRLRTACISPHPRLAAKNRWRLVCLCSTLLYPPASARYVVSMHICTAYLCVRSPCALRLVQPRFSLQRTPKVLTSVATTNGRQHRANLRPRRCIWLVWEPVYIPDISNVFPPSRVCCRCARAGDSHLCDSAVTSP
ncbi:uncharacterized protein B0H18DRAFT_100941 [Fomitopsis serialis]|uniref:uncharacterized protein n=1 Tax=Fomitopsis serialis TaxID=139415 RepID=UPI00200857A3|nr:uncharacterized protein B0H18DRAFT_100941 [Neoantrodia serialis]KAH9931237.1 hypothetical protein B0H18DRAFT_100941 [Neoantrodia serialis]